MARLPYYDPEQTTAEVTDTMSRLGTPMNVFRMVANASTTFRGFVRLGTAILSKQKLDHRVRELAILHVARASGSKYEWDQHLRLALRVGVTRPQVDAIVAGTVDAACFDRAERCALAMATELLRQARASDAVLAEARELWSTQEIVELVLAVGYYMMVARLLETAGVDDEPADRDAPA